MANRDRDETNYDSTGERNRRQRKTLPKPLLRLLLVLVAIIVIVVVIVVVARSVIHSGESAEYQRYMNSVEDILTRSDAVGKNLMQLLTNPGDKNRSQVQTQLDKFVAECESLEVEAKALEAPKDMIEQSIHQIFLLVMSFRQMGMAELKPAIMNALDVQDTEIAVEQITHALTYLVNSDFLYDEVFVTKATALLGKKELTGVTVPATAFTSDSQITAPANVLDMLVGLKSTGDRQAVHGVALSKVVAMPDNKTITAGGTFNLTASEALTFVVTVENQGNMDEKNVPVVITLKGTQDKEAQRVEVKIDQIKHNTEATIEVQGLNPTAYGDVATLVVKAGPVPDEKYADNNRISAKVIFKL
jgi:hypothetical protein